MITTDTELLMLIGDKIVKIYEKDKEIKFLKTTIETMQEEIDKLRSELMEVRNGGLVTSGIK